MYVGSLVNGVIPQGNYKITSTLQNGTFCYSVGGDDQYDYGSYMATDFDSMLVPKIRQLNNNFYLYVA